MMTRSTITLLTDFGVRDYFVAAMKGVMLGICPDAHFVDISHDVEPFDIHGAAWTLSNAWDCFPAGTVHLVVVDPGVGSARRLLAAMSGGHFFVAPDNGVLTRVLDAHGSPAVHEITCADYFRQPVSGTFHGRDIFAPAAAHLASGLDIGQLGPPTGDWVRLETPAPVETAPGNWTGAVLSVDRFGNIVTSFDWPAFRHVAERPFEMRAGAHTVTAYRRHYVEGGADEIFVTTGSAGFLEISTNQRNAAIYLNIKPGIRLQLRFI